MKKIAFIFFQVLTSSFIGQVLYSERVNTLSLSTYSAGTVNCQYAGAPANLVLMQDGFANNIGTLNNWNAPFHVPAFKNAGWVALYNPVENDTFLVSTSWFDDNTLTADRWFITPSVTIGPNTVISWLAKSPDALHPDGYNVYFTNNLGTVTPTDFPLGNMIYTMPDGRTAGGGEKQQWTKRSVNVGALYSGYTGRFAFLNDSKDMYQLWIDDIEVMNMADSLDASLTKMECNKYFKKNTAQNIAVSLKNSGARNLQNLTLHYRYGNSSVNNITVSLSPTLSAFQSTTIQFPQSFNFTQSGYFEVKAWIGKVNGISDKNRSNDTIRMFVTSQDTFPLKKILVEQFVSANDAENPDAQEKALALQTGSVIQVNIHHADAWTNTVSLTLKNSYMKETSTAMIDRVYQNTQASFAVKRQYYQDRVNARLNAVSPVIVTIGNLNYYAPTRALSFQVSCKFFGEVKGDYRIGAYLVENNVCGNKNDTLVDGKNQLSNYFNIPWSPYYQTGYYSPGADCWVLDAWRFKQQNMLTYAFDGMYGAPGIIPLNGGTNNQIYVKNYIFTVPSETYLNMWNPDNMYIVGFVSEYNPDSLKRNILNVIKVKMTTNNEVVGINENKPSRSDLMLFPNPSKGEFRVYSRELEYSRIIITDVSGKVVYQRDPEAGFSGQLDLSFLASGVYYCILEGKEGRKADKLIIQK